MQVQQFDTLYTRGSQNYIIVPVEPQEQTTIKEDNIMGTIFIDIVIAILAGALGLYLNSIKRGVSKLNTKVDALTDRVDKLDATVKAQTVTVMDISLCNNVMSRIDFKIQQSLEYLDRSDIVVSSFIVKMGQGAKEFIQWAIHNKLKVSEEEIRAKYELMNIEIRELLNKTPSEFSVKVRPHLSQISKHHVERVISIATDDLFNSKLDRFFTLTEQTINEVLTTIVRTRIENKS